jgi:DNA repair photolyase
MAIIQKRKPDQLDGEIHNNRLKTCPRLLTRFHSTPAAFCTCPPKYNINPYLGRCQHGCIYCYAPKFPSFRGTVRPRHDLVRNIEKTIEKTHPKLPVMLSDCTDPYQPAERDYEITRTILKALIKHGFPILIVTKSKLVTRDIDLLESGNSAVAVSISTLEPDITSRFEPGASTPEERLSTLQTLAEHSIPTIARVDPIIPDITDDRDSLERLMQKLRETGIRHVTAATMKLVPGFLQTLEGIDLELSAKLRERYRPGKWIAGYKYLPTEVRMAIISQAKACATRHSLSFSACREAYPFESRLRCDGSHLLECRKPLPDYQNRRK